MSRHSEADKSGKVTSGDRLTAAFLRWANRLIFFIIALPVPFYFVLRYLTATENAAVLLLWAMTSLALGSIAGLMAVALLLIYRKSWERKLRDRLTPDGVTVDELRWFTAEMTAAERRALKQIERQNALLADAYRETLAARLTATRLAAHAKREAVLVDRRLREATGLQSTEATTLQHELQTDRQRLERIGREAAERQAEVEARLRMIERAASRSASEAEVEMALRRLDAGRGHVPLGLEAARLEQQAREQTEEALRRSESHM